MQARQCLNAVGLVKNDWGLPPTRSELGTRGGAKMTSLGRRLVGEPYTGSEGITALAVVDEVGTCAVTDGKISFGGMGNGEIPFTPDRVEDWMVTSRAMRPPGEVDS